MKIISQKHWEKITVEEREFVHKKDSNFMYAFPVKNGEVVLTAESAPNYKKCLVHPELFDDRGIVTVPRYHLVPAMGICHCGAKVSLQEEYQGAFQCQSCGQWYNLYGEEVLPPDKWEGEI